MTIRIRTKIILSFASTLIPLLLLLFTAYYSRSLLFNELLNLYHVYHLRVLTNTSLSIDRAIMPFNDYLITGDLREKERFRKITGEVERNFQELEMIELDRKHLELTKAARARFRLLREKGEALFSIQNPVGSRYGARVMQELDDLAYQIIGDFMDKHYEMTRIEMEEKVAYTGAARKKVDIVLLSGALGSLIIAAIFGFYLNKSIVKPIGKFTEGALIIGKGRLDHRIEIRDGLEINLLAEEFNRMTDRLEDSRRNLEKKIEERTRELNELNRTLKEISIRDGLTSLYNYRYFYERLDEEIKRAARYKHPLSLIMADVDYFKKINDTYGHSTGDGFLKGVAKCIKENTRETDIAARYGGEEFSIILPETGREGAKNLAEKIRSCVMDCISCSDGSLPEYNLTMSLGVATFPDDSSGLEGLIKEADRALYRAKEGGRNRVEAANKV